MRALLVSLLLLLALLAPVIAPSSPDRIDVILPASQLPPSAQVLEEYPAIGYVRALVPASSAKAAALLTAAGDPAIKGGWELNTAKYRVLLDDSVPLVNANVTKALGFNGGNATVCILDTGIDYFHPNLPAPALAKDFTEKDWCIEPDLACPPSTGSPCNTSANPTVIGRQLNYSLNISADANVTDWLEIGAAWLLSTGTSPINRFDISVYYPNGTLANSTSGQNLSTWNKGGLGITTCDNADCYFNILNITINNTFGVYTIVWNDTNVTSPTWSETLLWGENITYLYDRYGWGNCGPAASITPVDYNESKSFYNIHPQDDNKRGSVNNAPGHGSHVAGIITSNDTTYNGVAPNATLLIGKVLHTDGYGLTSDINSGIQWCIDNGADIISLSLGGSATSNCNSSTDQLIDVAAKSGILPVIAAGNEGPNNGTIDSPGCARGALTVGATNKSDIVASFSSRGPAGYGTTKPEVVAPGISINSTILTASFGALSGTSQATPHVSGLAAVLKSQNASRSPEDVKAIIINSANQSQINGSDNTYGFGRVDFLAAVNGTNVTKSTIVNDTNITYVFNFTNLSSFSSTIVWLENSTDSHSKIYLYLKDSNGTVIANSTNENNTVQKVSATDPENGNWSLVVQGYDVYSSETFSLAYSSSQLLSSTTTKADGLACSSSEECSGGFCVHNICRSSATYCGDDYCDSGESDSNCNADCPSAPSGAGGGGASYKSFTLTASVGQWQDFKLSRGDSVEFNLRNESHRLRLSGILDDKREFTITSVPARITLAEGETKNLDLNGNSINDFSITLLATVPNGAVVRLLLLKEIAPEEVPERPSAVIKEAPEELPVQKEPEKKKAPWLFFVIAAFVLAIIVKFLLRPKEIRRALRKLKRRK